MRIYWCFNHYDMTFSRHLNVFDNFPVMAQISIYQKQFILLVHEVSYSITFAVVPINRTPFFHNHAQCILRDGICLFSQFAVYLLGSKPADSLFLVATSACTSKYDDRQRVQMVTKCAEV